MAGKRILMVLVVIAGVVTAYVLIQNARTSVNETPDFKKTQTSKPVESKSAVSAPATAVNNSTNDKKSMELDIKTTQEGTGERVVKNGDTISVHYTGKLTDGTKFDSSVDRGTPFEFQIGQGMVIAGWEKGFLGAKVGEKRTLTIPSEMGYGARGAGAAIPPNATLIFDVELIGIK